MCLNLCRVLWLDLAKSMITINDNCLPQDARYKTYAVAFKAYFNEL